MNKLKWNPKKIYNDSKLFDKDVFRFSKEIKKFLEISQNISTIGKIHNILKMEKRIDTLYYKILTYILVKKEIQESEHIRYKEKEVENLFSEYTLATHKLQNLFNSLSKDRQKRIMNSPQLKLYKRRIEMILSGSKRTSKKAAEFLFHLDPITSSISSIHSHLINSISFNQIKISKDVYKKIDNSNIKKLASSPDRNIRRKVYNEKRNAFLNTAQALTDVLDMTLKDTNLKSKFSKAKSPIEYVLSEDEIKETHLNKILHSILKNNETTSRFLKMKKEALGVSKLYKYDENYDVFNIKMSVNQSLKDVETSLQLFKNDSPNILKNLKKKNHLYINNKTNKHIPYSGYCQNFGLDLPFAYILFQNNLDSSMTVAHELGHAIHQEKLNQNNSFWDRDTSLIIHEIASYTHELVYLFSLLKNNNNKKTKKKILFKIAQYYYDVIVQKAIHTKFEKYLYKQTQNNKPLKIESLNQKYKEIQEEFKGKEFSLNKFSETEWIGEQRYTWNFYELKYIIAFSIASKIAGEIMNENNDYINKFNKMMKMGDEHKTSTIIELFDCSYNKMDLFINDAFSKMNSILDEFKAI